jgi:16S rRNA (guanine(1405)-N(7))-methyltransferase
VDEVVSAVASSKKYGAVCPDTIRRIAARELAANPQGSVKTLIKATKRGLHQICGAFEQGPDYASAYRQLEAAYRGGLEPEIRTACRQAMALHSSTRERLPVLDQFYTRIFRVTGWPTSILDLGCGLNPLALPWMGLAPGARYIGLDIDAAGIRFVNDTLQLAGFPPLARCQDLLANPPGEPADVALLFKTSPSLEHQEKGATGRLIETLKTPFVVISFAVKSLGGREKGMAAHYRQQFRALAEARRWPVEELAFDTELVFIVGAGL